MVCFTHYVPTKLLFGAGQLTRLGRQSLPGRHALLVAGPSAETIGAVGEVLAQLERAGVACTRFGQAQPNPGLRQVRAGAALARAEGCDLVIGLGGGSVMDTAKAIAAMAVNPGDFWDYAAGRGKPFDHAPLPVVAIPTTAGTGAEVSRYAVILNEDTGVKLGFGTEQTAPVLAVVDPTLTVTVPPKQTAFQGFDAFFHATETLINRNANPMGDLYARRAISLLAEALPAAVRDGSDLDARTNVALASTLAGACPQSASAHAMEHCLSGHHPELPHGAGLLMLSRAYYQHFVDVHACDADFIRMTCELGMGIVDSPQDFVSSMMQLEKLCGVDKLRMSDYGITLEELAPYAAEAKQTAPLLFFGDPAPLSETDAVKILEASWR